MLPPVAYDRSVETVQDDEAETVAQLNVVFDQILNKTAADYGHAVRAVHAKAHGVLAATLTVESGLPPELAQGLFAQPGSHTAYLRISTNAGDILPDAISLPRGMSLKVLDVPGERLPGSTGTTQDFLFVNGKVFQTETSGAFLSNLKLLAPTTDRMEDAKKVLSAGLRGVRQVIEATGMQAPSALTSLGGAPQSDPIGETYYSTTAFRYGDYIAKFSLQPVAVDMSALAGAEIDVDGRENAIREDVRRDMSRLEAEWAFCVQLCRELKQQPVEDATVLWDEADAPFVKVATLKASRQDSWSAANVQAIDEGMRFSVWTGIAAHRPLGIINRARRETYRHSADFRAAFNNCPLHEPTSKL